MLQFATVQRETCHQQSYRLHPTPNNPTHFDNQFVVLTLLFSEKVQLKIDLVTLRISDARAKPSFATKPSSVSQWPPVAVTWAQHVQALYHLAYNRCEKTNQLGVHYLATIQTETKNNL